jgi:acyl-CoA synthetase (AMP-forming)/AMP-acid ligase II
MGRLAVGGRQPLGYYKDPEKTAATFLEIDGQRYSCPGDFATIDEDGKITLLGRGSVCINTGGEKVFPEEVEQILVSHPDVYDVRVVGVDDARWGQRVCAVVALVAESKVDEHDLDVHCREHLAGYKVPRSWTLVDDVRRSPSGKADYAWARETVLAGATT